MTRRMEQVADLLQSEIAELLLREVKHPALTDAMLSITRVEVAPDFATARIHVSLLRDPASEPADEGELLAALTRSEPFMHRMLVKRLHLRRIPRLQFFLDHSIAEGDRLTSLMRNVAHGEGRDI